MSTIYTSLLPSNSYCTWFISDHSTSLEAVIVALTRVERRCDVSVAGLVQMRGRFLKESLKIEWESRLVEIIALALGKK